MVSVRPQYMTDGLKSIILKGIKVGSFLRVHPFYWSETEQRLKIRDRQIDLVLYKSVLAYITVEFCFVAIRAAQAISQQSVNLETQIVCAFYTVFHLFALVLAYGLEMCRDEFPDLLNSGFVLLTDFGNRIPPERFHPKIGIPDIWMLEKLQRIYFYSVNLATVAACFICFLKPQYPVLVSSLWSPTSQYNLASIGVSVVNQVLFQLVYIAMSYIMINIATGVAIPLISAITALGSKRMRTEDEIEENLQDFNKIRLLIDQFERVFLRFEYPASQYILIALSTFGMVGVIRLKGSERSMLTFIGMLTYVFLMLTFGGLASVHSRGNEVLRRWRQNYQIDQRRIRCLKPIRMNLSFYAYIDKGILLTSTDIIINSAITILLM